jgi:hypothetical protein
MALVDDVTAAWMQEGRCRPGKSLLSRFREPAIKNRANHPPSLYMFGGAAEHDPQNGNGSREKIMR